MMYEFEKDMMIEEFSSKLPLLLKQVEDNSEQKHYIYSAFYENRGYGGHGIIAIAKALEEHLGYTKVDLKNVDSLKSMGKKKRYVMAISGDLVGNKDNLKKLVSAFNHPDNAKGEYIQLFLASQGYNEGIDLHGIRHVHMFEPLLTFAANKQTIGRAARYCSHADLSLSKGEWTVSIHRYISDTPLDLSMFNEHYMTARMAYLKEQVQQLEERVNKTKGSYYDVLRSNYKNEISSYKEQIKELEKKMKQVMKMNLTNVKMIDRQLTSEAIESTKDMMKMYDAMKMAAIDYLLFKDFHSTRL